MNSERLLRLADFLENEIPPKKFNMARWMSVDRDREDPTKAAFKVIGEMAGLVEIVEPLTCQTVGCAMGWATTIPEFKEAGLVLLGCGGATGGVVVLLDPDNPDKYLNEYYACAKFFDIGYTEAYDLFEPGHYSDINDPLIVAGAIRKFVEKYAI